jgi:ABC-2 type transport system ATP-binding protein
VNRLCSDVLMMKQGQVVDRGTPAGLVEKYGRETLEQVFLHIARRDDQLLQQGATQ